MQIEERKKKDAYSLPPAETAAAVVLEALKQAKHDGIRASQAVGRSFSRALGTTKKDERIERCTCNNLFGLHNTSLVLILVTAPRAHDQHAIMRRLRLGGEPIESNPRDLETTAPNSFVATCLCPEKFMTVEKCSEGRLTK